MDFARDYLEKMGYDVEIEEVDHYKSWGEQQDQYHLREKIWTAYCSQ